MSTQIQNQMKLFAVVGLMAMTLMAPAGARAQNQLAQQAVGAPINLLEGLGYDEPMPDALSQELDIVAPQINKPEVPWPPIIRIIVDKADRTSRFNFDRGDTPQTMRVYVDHQLVYRFTVSTGSERMVCPKTKPCEIANTPTGSWRIQSNRRYKMYHSFTWSGAEMPFAQFFWKGWAIHATTPNHYARLGRRDSGGCVRLHLKPAKSLFQLVSEYGADNTMVTIYDSNEQVDPTADLFEQDDRNNALIFDQKRADGLDYIY